MAETVTAKVFMNGRIDTNEVILTKEDGKIIISPKKTSWKEFFDAFEGAADFAIERDTAPPQERDFFK
jgi:antitoxin VapB